MFGWLTRLTGGPEPAAAARPSAPASPAAAAAVTAGFGQRQPLVGRSGVVAGVVLGLPGALEQRLAGRGDEPAMAAHFAALLAAMRGAAQAGRSLLVQVPTWVLARPGVAGRQASAALQEDALARGRLLELLARQRGVKQPEMLFTVGLFSRLHLLLQMPLAAALEPLRLSADARQALLQGQGPWSSYLALADELERDDEARFAALCAPFGGKEPVLAEAERAWNWAAQVAR